MARRDIEQLKQHLLTIGGGGKDNNGFAYKGYEEKMDRELEGEFSPKEARNLISKGRLFSPSSVRMIRGTPNHCHTNVARLVMANPTSFTAWTGMSLCDDNVWRAHSWAVDRKGTVIETTAPRMIYYGCPVLMSTVEVQAKGW